MKESAASFLSNLFSVFLGIFITFTIQGIIDRAHDRKNARSSLELVRAELVKNIEDVSLIKDYLYDEKRSAQYFIDHKDSLRDCPKDSLDYHTGVIFADVIMSLSHDALELLKMSSVFQKIGDNDLSMKIIRAYDTCGAIVDNVNQHIAARDARFEKSIDRETAGKYALEGWIDVEKFIKTDYGSYAMKWITFQPDPEFYTDVTDLEEAISAIDSYRP